MESENERLRVTQRAMERQFQTQSQSQSPSVSGSQSAHSLAAKEAKQELMIRRRAQMESNQQNDRKDHLKAVKSQLMEVQRGRNLLSQSKTAATPSQTPKRRRSEHRGGNMLATATSQPFLRSPLHSASSSNNELDGPEPEAIDLRESNPSSLVKGKSVDQLQSPTLSSANRIHRKFSSFDDGDSVDDDEVHRDHSPRPKFRKMTHSPRSRRREHIVEPAQPFFRRHSGSVSIQKRRTLKDRTRSFHQTTTSKLRRSLPPQQTKLRHQAVSAVNVRRHDLRTPSRRTAVKRRSFHFVPSRPTV